MTLVELLITITIIAILASMVLGVAAMAAETAREARTRQLISRLHTLLIEHYDSYKTRRVKVRQQIVDAINNNNSLTPAQKSLTQADARLLALRELMLMEMPDRWSDVLLGPIPATNASNPPRYDPVFLDVGSNNSYARTGLSAAYLRRFLRYAANATSRDQVDALLENQGAECLYMIIMLATADGEAPSMFSENVIGDTDGDGAPEFLDGWGRPIGFLRWAPGFYSPLQLSPQRLEEIYEIAEKEDPGTGNDAVNEALALDHDPLDIYRRDLKDSGHADFVYARLGDDVSAYRLVPLIYSGGPDEDADINIDPTFPTDISVRLDPYAPASNEMLLGTPYSLKQDGFTPEDNNQRNISIYGATFSVDSDGNNSTDNIHNHLITDQ